MHSSDIESALMMVSAEVAVTILPAYCRHMMSDLDNVIFIPLHGEEEHEEILAAWRRNDDNPALRHFIELLRTE